MIRFKPNLRYPQGTSRGFKVDAFLPIFNINRICVFRSDVGPGNDRVRVAAILVPSRLCERALPEFWKTATTPEAVPMFTAFLDPIANALSFDSEVTSLFLSEAGRCNLGIFFGVAFV
jgi:hypothetical protein